MQRKRKRHRASFTSGVTLFPFLSVLFGVIGSMVLIMAGQAALSVASGDQVIEKTDAGETERQPIYIECRSDGVIIHPERVAISLAELKAGKEEVDKATDPIFDRLRTRLRNRSKREQARAEYRDDAAVALAPASNRWTQLIGRLAHEHDQRYPVFLIRPDGLDAFSEAGFSASVTMIDFGYEPVYASGEIIIQEAPRPDTSGAPRDGVNR